ncbi:MAG: HGGxSTG domain-containing protein [Pseudomonadota bacterium]
MTGAFLKQARIEAGLSQRGLARRAGVTHKTVQYWEAKAEIDPFAYAMKRIAKALGWRNTGTLHMRARHGVLSPKSDIEFIEENFTGSTRKLLKRIIGKRVICGAKTRKGTPCRALSEPGKRRCRFHGGLSTGPKTNEGRKRVSRAQQRRWAGRNSAD